MPSDNCINAFHEGAKVAASLGHTLIGTEHLLLGFLRTESTARNILRKLGIDDEAELYNHIREVNPPAEEHEVLALPFSRHATDAVGLAHFVANKHGSKRVDSQHVLLGIAQVFQLNRTSCGGARVITRYDIDPDTFEDMIEDCLRNASPPPTA